MKIYVSDIGDSSVGIQELTVAELELDQNMVEVLEDNNQMYSFKQEFKRLVEKYCAPEVSYDVFSDKDLEEEAKAEEEIMKEYCAGDVRATLEMYENKPKMQAAIGECEHPSNDNEPLMIVSIGDGNKLFLYRETFETKLVNNERFYYTIFENNEKLIELFNSYDMARRYMITNQVEE